MMQSADRNKIIANFNALVTDLDVNNVLPLLIQENVVSFDDEDVIQAEVGRRKKAEKLVRLLLTKGEKAFGVFCSCLENTSSHLAELLQSANSSSPSSECDVLSHVSGELKELYRRTLCRLSPIPWCKWFQVSLDNVYTSLNLIQAVHRQSFQADVTKSGCSFERSVQDLFTASKDNISPQRILIEGEPGIGKSTLCHKVVYDWSCLVTTDPCSCKNSVNCLQKFDLVFLLKARTLAKDESIVDAVIRQLFPDDFVLSASSIQSCIEENQLRTLLIIDGYDELQLPHSDLLRLIKRRILRRSTVIVTSRPAAAINVVHEFDAVFIVTGYDRERRLDFIDKYARENVVRGVDLTRFDKLKELLATDHTIADMCRNPLNLSILCMLHAEDQGIPHTTRTHMYKEVLSFCLNKASKRLSIDRCVLEQDIMPHIYRLSVQVLCENRYHFDEDELLISLKCNILDNLGFFTKEVSICQMRSRTTFVVNHRSYMEFFAAMHLQSLPSSECDKYIATAIKRKSLQNVVVFLFGLLTDSECAQHSFLQTLTNETYFSQLKFHTMEFRDIVESHALHLIFHCLCEMEQPVSLSLGNLVVQMVPSVVCFAIPWCNRTCINGFLKLCQCLEQPSAITQLPKSTTTEVSSSDPSHQFELMISAEYAEKHCTILQDVMRLHSVNCVSIFNITSVSSIAHFLPLLKIGYPNSTCHSLKLSFLPVLDSSNELSVELFGHDIEQLELHNCPCSAFLQRCIEDTLHMGMLRSFAISMSVCKLSVECCTTLARCLSSLTNLDTFSFVGHILDIDDSETMLEVMRSLRGCSKLRVLKLSHLPSFKQQDCNSSEKELQFMGVFSDILSLPMLEDVCIFSSRLSSEAFQVLRDRLKSGLALKRLKFTKLFPNRPAGIGLLLHMLPSVSTLTELSIIETELCESGYVSLGDVIARSPCLISITVSPLNSSMVEPISAGLQNNKTLAVLRLLDVGFAHGSSRGFALAVRNHPSLKVLELSLHPGNYLIDAMIEELLSAIEARTGLQELALCRFGLTDHHMVCVGSVVCNNDSIAKLNLSDNKISGFGIKCLLEFLVKRRKLDVLDLSDCFVTKSDSDVKLLRFVTRSLKVNWF